MPRMNFEKQIEPFEFTDLQDGRYVLSLSTNKFNVVTGECDRKTYKEGVFKTHEAQGFSASAYDWTCLAMVFMEETMPELRTSIAFSPADVRFAAVSYDKAALQRFAIAFHQMSRDDTVMSEMLKKVPGADYYTHPALTPDAYRHLYRKTQEEHSHGRKPHCRQPER